MTHPPTPEHTIRNAHQQDVDEIARLLTDLGHPTSTESVVARWSEWMREGNLAVVAALGDGTLLGVATLHRMTVLHRPRPVGRITALVVDPAARGRGIGRDLVAAAEERLADAGCGLLEVTSNLRRTEAHAFYEHLGYERTSARFAKSILRDADGLTSTSTLPAAHRGH